MADHVVPHFHNDPGVPVIEIGSQEFMCVGANPPFDHPHVFLDIGDDNEIICPYCSTLYRHDPELDAARGTAGRMRADGSGRLIRPGWPASRVTFSSPAPESAGLTAALAMARAVSASSCSRRPSGSRKSAPACSCRRTPAAC